MTDRQNVEIEETVRKERGRLLNFIRKRVRDEADAQDILQDVFWQLTEAYRGLETIERVTSWLFRVARNKIVDSYRKKRPETLLRDGVDGGRDRGIAFEDTVADSSMDPERLHIRDVLWDEIETALEELPPAQREVFLWHEFEGMSFKVISEITGDTENALRLRKLYAIRFLRKRLESLYDEV